MPGSSVAWYSDGRGSMKTFFPEIIPTAIFSLPLIQVGQLSVNGNGHLVLVNCSGSLLISSVVRLSDGSPYVPQVPG